MPLTLLPHQRSIVHYRNSSKVLVILCLSKGHICGCQLFGFGWKIHHTDLYSSVIFSLTILNLYKDIFGCSCSQQVGGRHQLPGERERTKLLLTIGSGQKIVFLKKLLNFIK